MGQLQGKKALVTGGGQGIGQAIVDELAQAGCDVVVHYFKSATGAQTLVSRYESKVKIACFQADLTDHQQAATLVKQATNFLGGLDILVNNTGDLLTRRRLEEIDLDFWHQVLDVNMTSMMSVTQHALPHLKAAGQAAGASVVNLSSLAGRKGGHGGSLAYATFKGAILTWTRALSAEIAPLGIRVNTVAPGLILGTSFHNTHTTDESVKKTIEGIPLGRAGHPADVARAVRFFASEYDGFINGATLDINGGSHCY